MCNNRIIVLNINLVLRACVFYLYNETENVHQLDFQRSAQMAHHRAGERTPFGLRAKPLQNSCNDASSRCRSETNQGLERKFRQGVFEGSHTLIFYLTFVSAVMVHC